MIHGLWNCCVHLIQMCGFWQDLFLVDPNIPLQEGYTYAPIFYTLNHISILDEDIKEIRRGMVRLLIEAGADLSITLDGGITPLSLAERANETEIALMMLAADAKPNSVVNNR